MHQHVLAPVSTLVGGSQRAHFPGTGTKVSLVPRVW